MPRISRFKKRESDRSGFDYFEVEMIKDKAWKVGIDEFDPPPMSRRSLGGEGDSNASGIRDSSNFDDANPFDTPAGFGNPTVLVTAGVSISHNFNEPWMRISGSAAAVDLTADPQITRGKEGDILTLQCVDSGVTLDHGTGLNLAGSSRFVMTSGSVITFYYSSGGSVWNETSRSRRY